MAIWFSSLINICNKLEIITSPDKKKMVYTNSQKLINRLKCLVIHIS